MAIAKMTLIGFYSYMENIGQPLFEFLDVPDGIDKETLINTILMRGGEFEPVYMNPEFIRQAVKSFSIKHKKTFEKWIETLSVEYNPIENYDRYEEYTDTNHSDVSTGTHSSTSSNSTNEGKTSAYDSNEYQPHDFSTNINSASDIADSNTIGDNTTTHTAHIHGNIGVTTSAQMQKEVLNLYLWNIYEHIADLFIEEYCIMIY